MARSTKSVPKRPTSPDPFARHPPRPPAGPPEVVDPRWLLKALGLVIFAAFVCGYLTLCLLVYQGQWQLVLHPLAGPTPAPPSLNATPLRFGAAESGQARLSGWWIPSSGPHSTYTVLFLHDGSGNLASNTATLQALNAIGLNIFAIDYRGFGASDPTHPTQQRMTEDTSDALTYLVETRHLSAATILPYGVGTGAFLAAQLTEQHHELRAVILESPQPDLLSLVKRDARANITPLSLLFHERFDIAPILTTLPTPKLILTTGPSPVSPIPDAAAVNSLTRSAASPSLTVHLPSATPTPAYTEALNRFLDEYLH